MGGGGQDQQASGSDVMSELQEAIQCLHELMAMMPDAKHTQMINQSMAPLLAIQSELSQAKSATNPRQQLLQKISG